MKQRGKAVTAGCILLALLAGVGFTKAGSKYRTQEEVNLIFSNVTSGGRVPGQPAGRRQDGGGRRAEWRH